MKPAASKANVRTRNDRAKKKGLHRCRPFFCYFYMVHSGGFEPPTARFVAEYSIQLSYECTERAHYKVLISIIK